MTSIVIYGENMIPRCGDCGMPVPKTVEDVVVAMSHWPIICMHCKHVAREINYIPPKALSQVA